MSKNDFSKHLALAQMLTRNKQKRVYIKQFGDVDQPQTLLAVVQYDDECRNGHKTFTITGDHYIDSKWVAGGVQHDLIAEHLPELVPFLKWHLCSSEGPLHYISNTMYLAGERDCWGCLKGEARSYRKVLKFANFPVEFPFSELFIEWLEGLSPLTVSQLLSESIDRFGVLVVPHPNEPDTYSPNYTFSGFPCEWHECVFDSEREAQQWREVFMQFPFEIKKVPDSWGTGKARELDLARHAAIWPEATDEDLTAPGLKERLEARLPALLLEFRKAVEHFGFEF